jgi:hypothetical protein
MWLTIGRIGMQHVASFGQVIGCHVAQSWAATWHPGIGCSFVNKNFMESVGVEPQTSPMVMHFGRVWATTSPHGGSY